MPALPKPLLIPSPSALHLAAGPPRRLESAISYQGPIADAAFRLLSPACGKHTIHFIPGMPRGEAKGVTIILGEEEADSPGGEHGYRLMIDEPGIRLRAGGEAGVRYALVTLAQLIRQYGRELPALHLADQCATQTRGLMLDISRCRVPTMSQLYALVDDLERLKMNHLQLYMEHTFAYVGHEEVWANASPLTPDEIKELDQYCLARGVELSACLNTLGHMERWFAHERYRELAEIPDRRQEWTFHAPDGRAITKRGPFSLCPTDPRSIELVRDLLDQLLPCFSSKRVNIGCDEAFDVGQGRSKSAVGERGVWEVYREHLSAVNEIVRSHGKRSLFWGDMLSRHTGHDNPPDLPDEMMPLVWGYESSMNFLQASLPAFAWIRRAWYCPGTSSWLSIVGRASNRRENLRNTTEYGPVQKGFLVCDWGDRGHRQHWLISLIAIANAAHDSWTSNPEEPFDPRAASLHLFDDDSLQLGPWLEALGDVDAELNAKLELRNTGALYTELHRPLGRLPADPNLHGSLADWESIRSQLAELRSQFDSFDDSVATSLVRAELEHTLRQAEHAADKAIVCRAEPDKIPRGPARIRLAADMGSIVEEYRELWHSRARPGGLDESAAWFERLIDDYEHAE